MLFTMVQFFEPVRGIREMTRFTSIENVALFLAGAALGGLAVATTMRSIALAGQTAASGTEQSDVAHLKDIVPPASHPMVELGYHMVNLWFAAQRG
jgi:hypothetical protein